jgi:FAD:protein FMN transferase
VQSVATFPALGTTATLVLAGEGDSEQALELLFDELAAFDLACSRFRADSELVAVNNHPPAVPVPVSALLLDAVEAGLRAAQITGGRVDPTVGSALDWIGYDRDFQAIDSHGPPLTYTARPTPGWQAVTVNRSTSTVRLKAGVRLDLGATAKALCADRAASKIAARVGVGALVSLGGDIAVAGPPPTGGWPVKISDNHTDPLDGPGPVVAIGSGGLATSSTTVRRWQRGSVAVHHLIDPATSQSAREHWRTVSVAAGSCLDANIASCAAILMAEAAPSWLAELALPARLEDLHGQVTTLAGWPADPEPHSERSPLELRCS